MSITWTHQITCDCGASIDAHVCESVNAERHPELRAQILDRTLHSFQCGACGRVLQVDNRLSYVDLVRKQFYGVAPERERLQEGAIASELATAWRLAFGEQAPASLAAMLQPERFHLRLCFGLEELREKLVGHDAGIDDLALECYKVELLAANPAWADAQIRTLRLDHVEPDGRLAFYFERAIEPMIQVEVGLVADRGRYDELAATAWATLLAGHRGIASGPYVSVLRLLAA